MGWSEWWSKVRGRETRAGLTDTYIAGLTALASGDRAHALRSGAVETAAGVWGRALASARVEGPGAEFLTPEILEFAGRELITEGEAVLARRAMGVIPARISDVTSRGRYKLEYQRPPGTTVMAEYSPEMVLHFRWTLDPVQHWRGLGPYARPVDAVQLGANIELALREEASSPRALILPLPAGEHATDDLARDIAGAKGGAIMAESTASGWDAGRAGGTLADWKAQRLGPMPTQEATSLYREAFDTLLALAGVPPSLGAPAQADGTRLREDYRRFVLSSVAPVARGIEHECARKGLEVSLDFHALHAHDIQGRSTALKTLVDAGVDLVEARRLTGL